MATTTSAPRAPLTATEQATLKSLVHTLKTADAKFCCGGTMKIPAAQGLQLLYKLGSTTHARSIDLCAIEPDDIPNLLESCVPAPHGRNSKTVYDESYRLARELPHGAFALTTDVLDPSVLDILASLTSPRAPGNTKLAANLYKLNAYTAGGFFKAHRDTPKSDRHVGTLIMALPVPFEGGVLRVSHEGKDALFDWSAAVSTDPILDDVCLPWAFVFSDVEHEVLPVRAGTRVTIAYDIAVSDIEPPSPEPVMDTTTLAFYAELATALKNPEFLPQGGKVGIALSHAYPMSLVNESCHFASRLKGRDAVLHRVLLELKVPMELRAVYAPADYYREVYNMDGTTTKASDDFPADGFGPQADSIKYPSYNKGVLHTSKVFGVVHGQEEWHDGEAAFVREKMGAAVEPDIIWACKPTGSAYSAGGSYMAYANQASLSNIYVTTAMVLDIPVVGQPGGIRVL